jgi:hypothetical protein
MFAKANLSKSTKLVTLSAVSTSPTTPFFRDVYSLILILKLTVTVARTLSRFPSTSLAFLSTTTSAMEQDRCTFPSTPRHTALTP